MEGKHLAPNELCLLRFYLAQPPTAPLLLAIPVSWCNTCKGVLGLWAELMESVMQVCAER